VRGVRVSFGLFCFLCLFPSLFSFLFLCASVVPGEGSLEMGDGDEPMD